MNTKTQARPHLRMVPKLGGGAIPEWDTYGIFLDCMARAFYSYFLGKKPIRQWSRPALLNLCRGLGMMDAPHNARS